jgi:hypothetical protein
MDTVNAEQKAARRAERERTKFDSLDNRTWLSAQQWARHVGIAEGTAARYFALGVGPRSVLIGNGRRIRRDWSDQWVLEGGVTQPDRAAVLRSANKTVAARKSEAQLACCFGNGKARPHRRACTGIASP